jgi:putative ABC transport system substrate-binding protein
MKRRAFINLLSGTTAAGLLPSVVRAQQAMPVIGFLHMASPVEVPDQVRAVHQGLKEAGFVEGENVAIQYRWAEGQVDRLPALADELVRRRVAVILTFGGVRVISAVKAATATIPIVFAVAEDPVRLGLVASLARPGGNLTGINFLSAEVAAKRLELLRELVPGAARVAVLVNPSGPTPEITLRDVQAAARTVNVQLLVLEATNAREIEAAFATLARERCDALFIGPDPLFTGRRVQLALLSVRHTIPAAYSSRTFPEAGGLMSYGSDLADATRQSGVYTGRILKGAKPADLPVLQMSKFELVINLQAARLLGVTVPQSLQVAADALID